MTKGCKLAVIIGAAMAVVAVVASITTLLLYLDKKRSDEELEEYLDCAIE